VLLGDLVPAIGLRLDDLVLTPSTAVALLVSTSSSAACLRYGTPSDSVHSRYRRTVADLPCQDRPVALRLLVRRFRYVNPSCPRAIFCERLPGLLDAHARSTARLTDVHRAIGFALGGEAGARLAEHPDMPTSPDTLLRRVRGAADEPAPSPRFVGVDDWAVRNGQRYGTILIDLERGHVIDILPGRGGEALKAWLKQHPGVEVITRDRWSAYAQAVTEGAPEARQVADRWHLLRNLREAVQRLLERHSAQVRAALQETPAAPEVAAPAEEPRVPTPSLPRVERPATPRHPSAPEKQARQARHQERARQYERVKELRAHGQSLLQIARETGLSKGCVIRYLRTDRCPD
jgi:transposase